MSLEVVVIGAGAAGLTVAIDLAKAGFAVTILEARDRIGGRMFTVVDPATKVPVELGAEFVHGKPPEIWDLIRAHDLKTREVEGEEWCYRNGQLNTCDFFSQVDEIFGPMNDHGPDQSFSDYLKQYCPNADREVKEWATGYVQGFHAADPDAVSVHSLVRSNRAEEEIEGDRSFHIDGGYAALLAVFEKQLAELGVKIHLNTSVEKITWNYRGVEIEAAGARTFSANRAVVTLPLGVLQTGAVQFCPALPKKKLTAMSKLAMGHVIRVTFSFSERFWDGMSFAGKTLSNMSFLLSRDEWFPTWWTRAPEKSPVITAWAPFPSADRLSGKSESFVVDKSLETLSRLLGVSKLGAHLNAAYVHDWQSDPWSRGAYSYVKVGGDRAEQDLGAPLNGALFFAGEATDIVGNNGTVNGAIASGKRVAKEITASSGHGT